MTAAQAFWLGVMVAYTPSLLLLVWVLLPRNSRHLMKRERD